VDLSCCGRRICIFWKVRLFSCDAPNCARITFTEQPPGMAHKYARKTQRLSDRLYRLGLEVGEKLGDACRVISRSLPAVIP
jgi:hypothetical protein